MKLLILRHAIAIQRGTPGFSNDDDRPLTPKGEKKMRRIAEAMLKLEFEFDLILSSPLLRAKRTADIVAEVFAAEGKLRLSDNLSPDGDPSRLVEEILGMGIGIESVLLVGHEPYLSRFISTLLAGDASLQIVFKKGGLCKLETPSLRYGRCASLELLLAPAQMTRIK